MASNISQAFNLMIARGLPVILREVGFWNEVYGKAEGLTKLLEEDRSR